MDSQRDSQRDMQARLAAQIAEAVRKRIGGADAAAIGGVIEQEVAAVLGERPIDQALMEAAHERAGEVPERVVVTAAGVISEVDGDILDISQTVVAGYFTMIIVVDISSEGASFSLLRERLREVGIELGIHVVALHEDILSSMHTV